MVLWVRFSCKSHNGQSHSTKTSNFEPFCANGIFVRVYMLQYVMSNVYTNKSTISACVGSFIPSTKFKPWFFFQRPSFNLVQSFSRSFPFLSFFFFFTPWIVSDITYNVELANGRKLLPLGVWRSGKNIRPLVTCPEQRNA